MVRWCPAFALLLATGQVAAARPGAAREDPAASALWREVIEPHGAQVAALVTRARAALSKLGDSGDAATPERRRKLAGDAYGMLRHARKLSPENPEVLGLLGTAADEIGNTRQAIDALEACIRLQGPERAGADVTGRLGAIYLRLGKLDEAVRWLRYAQGPIAIANNAASTVNLATALADRGDMAGAIDVLANALPVTTSSYYTDAVTLVSFALAVHYDRDEQRGAAFEVLDHMQSALQQELGPFVERSMSDLAFAPAEDAYYYQALLYEALGAYTEARAEWALYAAVPGAPWHRRALEHLDALRTASPNSHPKSPVP